MSLFEKIIIKLNEGGPFFMYTILILLIVIVALFIREILTKKELNKTIQLLKSLSWFTIAWGYFGRTIGLIVAFDNVAAHGDLPPSLLAGGLKMALLNPLFAIITFLIARLFIILLILKQKKD